MSPITSSTKKQPARIPVAQWFERIVGMHEEQWRKEKNKEITSDADDNLSIVNSVTGDLFVAGKFSLLRLGDLIDQVQESVPPRSRGVRPCMLELVTRTDKESTRKVDVAHLQSLPENANAVFQVASNFNGVEAISDSSAPDSPTFTEDYVDDLTQGPAASISAGPAAIARVFAAFHDPRTPQSKWNQTKTRQVDFLGELSDHFPMVNGYVVLKGDEPPFPKPGSREYKRLMTMAKVGYHENCQVTTGHRSGGVLEVTDDPDQRIDQVFCAAMNIAQGHSGMRNRRAPSSLAKCQFILESQYEATYLSAILHGRKKLFLTLIGGGVFGNSKETIYQTIINVHKKWADHPASSLETVSVVLYSAGDLLDNVPAKLKSNGILFRWLEYTKGVPRIVDSN